MNTNVSQKLSLRTKLAYGIGVAGDKSINTIIMYFAMFYFTDIFGIAPAVAGTMILVARLWDAINDPMIGIVIDRTNTSKGKARPYILYGSFAVVAFLILIFYGPSLSQTGRNIWIYVTYIGLGMSRTVTLVALLTLMPRLTKNSLEQVSLSSTFLIGTSAGGLVASSLWMTAVTKLGKGDVVLGYRLAAVAFGITALLCYFICYFNTKEIEVEETKEKEKIKILDALKIAAKNGQFLILAAINLISGIGLGIYSGALVYYIMNNIQRPDLVSVSLPITLGTMFLASITSTYILKRIDRKKGLIISFIIIIVVTLIRIITKDSSPTLMLINMGIVGLFYGYYTVFNLPMLIDSMDYGELKTGKRLEGVIMSAYSMQAKMGAGIGGALFGFILERIGYDSEVVQQSGQALNGLFHSAVTSYIITFGLCLFLILFYKLNNKKMQEVRNELAQKRS